MHRLQLLPLYADPETSSAKMRAYVQFLVFLAFSTGSLLASAQSCYYPNGDEATDNQTPCDAANAGRHGGTTSTLPICCSENWQCLDNGLCLLPSEGPDNGTVGDGWYGRYGCQNEDFSGCPRYCVGECGQCPVGGFVALTTACRKLENRE